MSSTSDRAFNSCSVAVTTAGSEQRTSGAAAVAARVSGSRTAATVCLLATRSRHSA
ncbi:hypothetical protein ABZ797_44865 [Streptomyces antimycoticus]|uniref:hypothetical protein n=1 Tax=Streptomyces antimycoticus TaxID=68175 RepID=UPI00340D664D